MFVDNVPVHADNMTTSNSCPRVVIEVDIDVATCKIVFVLKQMPLFLFLFVFPNDVNMSNSKEEYCVPVQLVKYRYNKEIVRRKQYFVVTSFSVGAMTEIPFDERDLLVTSRT